MRSKDPTGRDSYNELMNEWVETRNVMLRMQGGILHPPAYLSPIARLLGYVWRILVALLLVGIVYVFLLKRHLGSKDFSEMIAEKTKVLVGSDKAKMEPFSWKGKTGVTKTVTLTGGDSFFEELTAESVRIKLNMGTLLSSVWDLGDVFISELRVKVKSGGSGGGLLQPSTAATGIPLSRQVLAAGWGVNPDFSKLTFNKIEVASANFEWGLSELTKGSLANAAVQFKRADGVWQLVVSSGRLSQNYLQNLQISSLVVKFLPDDNEIGFSDGSFTLGDASTGSFSGSVETGEEPNFDVKIQINNFDVTGLLNEDFPDFMTGRADGAINLTGSTNRRAGIQSAGTLQFSEDKEETVRFHSIQLMRDLGGVLGDLRIQRPLVTGGHMSFTTSEGVFRAWGLDLEMGEFSRLTGEFAYGVPRDYDLQLMSVENAESLPEAGSFLVVVALVDKGLHLRIFDPLGKKAIDKSEGELDGGLEVTALRELLNKLIDKRSLSDQGALPQDERYEIVRKAAIAANYNLPMLKSATKQGRSQPQSDPGAPTIQEIEEKAVPEFYGEVRFGIERHRLDKLSKAVVDHFFPKESDGKVWMTIPLSGPLGRLTSEQSQELMSAVRAKEVEN